jgi:hypothetical protein
VEPLLPDFVLVAHEFFAVALFTLSRPDEFVLDVGPGITEVWRKR